MKGKQALGEFGSKGSRTCCIVIGLQIVCIADKYNPVLRAVRFSLMSSTIHVGINLIVYTQ